MTRLGLPRLLQGMYRNRDEESERRRTGRFQLVFSVAFLRLEERVLSTVFEAGVISDVCGANSPTGQF